VNRIPPLATSIQMETDKTSPASSGDESDDDAEEKAMELYKAAETEPRNYDAHLVACKALRACGALIELRKARELFSKEYPLTPSMWLEWIEDEVVAQGDNKRAKLFVADLYSRAVADYYSPTLWLARISHEMIMYKEGFVTIERVRRVYEDGISTAGFDIKHASSFWSV
jgi:hypothetical protein